MNWLWRLQQVTNLSLGLFFVHIIIRHHHYIIKLCAFRMRRVVQRTQFMHDVSKHSKWLINLEKRKGVTLSKYMENAPKLYYIIGYMFYRKEFFFITFDCRDSISISHFSIPIIPCLEPNVYKSQKFFPINILKRCNGIHNDRSTTHGWAFVVFLSSVYSKFVALLQIKSNLMRIKYSKYIDISIT